MRQILLILLALTGLTAAASDNFATLRNGAIANEAQPPRMSQALDTDIKPQRNYPMQPPTIPHKIDGYQVDLNVNRCMACHSRRNTAESRATMISVTHYMDREANFLATISPRRYFCGQCHVVQTNATQLVGNEYIDIDDLLAADQPEPSP